MVTTTPAARAESAPKPRRVRPAARFRMRVTAGEVVAIGPGKIALLEAIAEARSITAAAKAIGMSYRRAWILVDEVNAALKRPAVASAKGGERGGGSELTEVGLAVVALYRQIEEKAELACADEIGRLLRLMK